MPVTIRTCNFKAETWTAPSSVKLTSDPSEILQAVDPDEAAKCDEIWRCTSSETPSPDPIAASPNGLIHAVVEAWNNHYNLVLRPDDFWFAIISQLSFYINANAEALRSHFVAHKGKKKLVVEQDGTKDSVNYADFADTMAVEIGENVKDPKLRDWILPDFSTTTPEDMTVAAVLFMGAMQKYFEYYFDCCTCAIPEITLLGEREDWVKLQDRLPQLLAWGDQSKTYHKFLVPIFKNIVSSFDDPKSESVVDFWKAMVSPHGPDRGSGGKPYPYVTGWISGLFVWNHDGRFRDEVLTYERVPEKYLRNDPDFAVLDGVYYPRMHLDKELVPAVASVPVTVREVVGGVIMAVYDTRMVAGICGFKPCEAPPKPPDLEPEHGATNSNPEHGTNYTRRKSRVSCSSLLRHFSGCFKSEDGAKAGGDGEKGSMGSSSDEGKSKESVKGSKSFLGLPPIHYTDRTCRTPKPRRLGPGLNTVKLEPFWLIYKTKGQGKPADD